MLPMGLSKTRRRFLLFTFSHAALTIALTVYALSAAMAEFDHPERRPSQSAAVAGDVAGVLGSPLRLLWTSWASTNLPNALEWLWFLSNSALWGLGLTLLTCLRSNHYARTQPNAR